MQRSRGIEIEAKHTPLQWKTRADRRVFSFLEASAKHELVLCRFDVIASNRQASPQQLGHAPLQPLFAKF